MKTTKFGDTLISGPDVINQCLVSGGQIHYFDFEVNSGPLWTDIEGEVLDDQEQSDEVWARFHDWWLPAHKAKITDFFRRDDEFWGVEYDDEGCSHFTDLGYSGVQCTGFAKRIKDMLGDRVEIFGFSDADNPGTLICQLADGHDFAVVDGRWIVDPWLTEVENGQISAAVQSPDYPDGYTLLRRDAWFDLHDSEDCAEALRWYGPLRNWKVMDL